MTPLPVAFSDLPAAAFPFTVELLNTAREVVWSTTVTGPGAIHVPGTDELGPGPRTARITYPGGRVEESGANDQEES